MHSIFSNSMERMPGSWPAGSTASTGSRIASSGRKCWSTSAVIEELRGIRTTDGGIEIGALTTLTEIVKHPVIREQYGLLAEAAELIASPQIRNQGTIGGNVSQDTRCWYYRAGWPCYRAGGNICYADTPTGRNREHAILHAERCVAVNPSDSAPALIALDAKFVIRTPKGERVVDAEDYFIGPDIDITRLHILKPGDLLTAIRIPSTYGRARDSISKKCATGTCGTFL
jgi:xanthine dehydrogenase YagS FAD-binding subunit